MILQIIIVIVQLNNEREKRIKEEKKDGWVDGLMDGWWIPDS